MTPNIIVNTHIVNISMFRSPFGNRILVAQTIGEYDFGFNLCKKVFEFLGQVFECFTEIPDAFIHTHIYIYIYVTGKLCHQAL